MYLLPLLRLCDRVRPEGDCHVTGDPVRKIVAMATRRLNELMNHSGTPQLRRISVSLRARWEGAEGCGQASIRGFA